VASTAGDAPQEQEPQQQQQQSSASQQQLGAQTVAA
jgi:hypothetical protein